MPQQRQSRDLIANGKSDQFAVGIRPAAWGSKPARIRRPARSDKCCRLFPGAVVVFLALALCVTVLAYCYISRQDGGAFSQHDVHNDLKDESALFQNRIRTENNKVLNFGHGSVAHGRDSRDWDRDDRRRDEDYNEDAAQHASMDSQDESAEKGYVSVKAKDDKNKSALDSTAGDATVKGTGLYNEAGRNELKFYEEKYEASLKDVGQLSKENSNTDQISDDNLKSQADLDDGYDDGIDFDDLMEDNDNARNKEEANPNKTNKNSDGFDGARIKSKNVSRTDSTIKSSYISSQKFFRDTTYVLDQDANLTDYELPPWLDHKKKPKKHKKPSRSCEMKLLNSTAQLVEPLESRKFARFSLQYTEVEEKPPGQEQWEPKFSGHQTLQEREQSFLASDQKINCGFVKGPKGYPSTGFDLAEDDISYISRCHIAVISCIFGNSDRLRSPTGKKVSRLSRKNVCFVMFLDEGTLQTLSSEGQVPDGMGFIGLWKVVVVKNLPYTDMRRVGKIPKLLSHRLFPAARYSIWLDSKLRLQLDPLLILEYFLWRKGYEFAISNHYDRHCIWEEVAQNKKLNKYNHTLIDEQFVFYQADGLKRFNASDPDKLLPSNVPEGSFIVKAHTPMSNLFSCLWFNEVDRFTPRDQLSFAYTYQKLRRMNPDKPFHLNMFKDCERRAVAKLFHHRADEKPNVQAVE